jgi:hypothetical protein
MVEKQRNHGHHGSKEQGGIRRNRRWKKIQMLQEEDCLPARDTQFLGSRDQANPLAEKIAMGYEIEGTIKVIMDVLTFGSGFTKREFVITSGDDKYPQDIKMEFVKDKVALLDRFRPGQRVKVGFEIRGNENNGKFYVSLSAWRIGPADGSDGGGDAPMERPRESSGPPRQDRGGYGGGGARPSGGGAPERRSGGGFDQKDRSGPRGGGRPPAGGGRDFDDGGGAGRRGGKYEDDDVDF